MDQIVFLVQGSAPEPYEVYFSKSGNNLTAHCTCPAGENGLYCKHRFRILAGKTEGIVSDNKEDVKIVQSWLKGSDVEEAMNYVLEMEKEVEKAKKKHSAAKKKLARAMND